MSNQITIVIPAYNRAHTLPRTLLSVEKQTVAPARVVLVDNASTDGTFSLMSDWASRQTGFEVLLLREEKAGACAARNCGLREVETEFVMFFDSDDEMLPSHVEDFSKAIARNPGADIFGRSIITEDIAGHRRKLYFTHHDPMFNHLFRGCLSTQRIVARTALVRRVGGWNEDLPAWNDFELGVRLLLASDRIVSLPGDPSVITYQLAESITGTSFSAKAGQWEKALDCIEKLLSSAGRTDLLKWIDCRRMILAAHYAQEGSADLAAALRGCTAVNGRGRRRLSLIYSYQLSFRRLAWCVARLIFIF